MGQDPFKYDAYSSEIQIQLLIYIVIPLAVILVITALW